MATHEVWHWSARVHCPNVWLGRKWRIWNITSWPQSGVGVSLNNSSWALQTLLFGRCVHMWNKSHADRTKPQDCHNNTCHWRSKLLTAPVQRIFAFSQLYLRKGCSFLCAPRSSQLLTTTSSNIRLRRLLLLLLLFLLFLLLFLLLPLVHLPLRLSNFGLT